MKQKKFRFRANVTLEIERWVVADSKKEAIKKAEQSTCDEWMSWDILSERLEDVELLETVK